MSDAERAAAIEEIMQHVQTPWRSTLLDLLQETPEAYNLFSRGFVYEAFVKIKEATPSCLVLPKGGGRSIDLDFFLGQQLEGMPSFYHYAADATCFD